MTQTQLYCSHILTRIFLCVHTNYMYAYCIYSYAQMYEYVCVGVMGMQIELGGIQRAVPLNTHCTICTTSVTCLPVNCEFFF